tara:strand:+ start:74 stop:877 length:804 start_codon:yes stop_codon:yes gene_type:complete
MLKDLIKTGFIYLDTHEVLKIVGDIEKVEALLQGQVTSDVSELPNNGSQISCLLDQKGFIQADFILLRLEDEILVVIKKSLSKNFINQLEQFTQFYKVEIKLTNYLAKGFVNKDKSYKGKCSAYYKYDEYFLHMEVCKEPDKEEISNLSQLEWKVANKILLNYLFDIDDINKYRPNELNYDKTRVSFDKGCFRGQEIVARVHYLGVNRREFVSAIIPIDKAIDSKLKIQGETLEFLKHKIFNTHIKKDEIENKEYNSINLIRYLDSN